MRNFTLYFIFISLISFSICAEEGTKTVKNSESGNVSTKKETEINKKDKKPVESAEVRAIRRLFEVYKQAIINKDGEEIASLLSQESVEYYEKQRESALYIDKDSFFELSAVDQMHVLSFV